MPAEMSLLHHPTAAHAFHAAAQRAATAPAVRHRGVQLSYLELQAISAGVAARLRARGIGRGDLVATVLDRGPWPIAAMLGAWAVGAAYVHIDVTEPLARITGKLETARPAATLVDERTRPWIESQVFHCLPVEGSASGDYAPPDCVGHGDLAYMAFTSGSTGVPKAVQVEHGAVLAYCSALFDRIAPVAPVSYGLSTTLAADLGNTCVFGALLSGGRLDIYDRDVVLDATALAQELQRHPVDCLKYTPSQLGALAAGDRLGAVLPLQLLLLGGEVFPPALVAAISDSRPSLRVYNHYGPSEATVGVLMHDV